MRRSRQEHSGHTPSTVSSSSIIETEKAKFLVSKLAQADEANLDRDVYDEKTNESQIEVSQLPASNLAARHLPDHHTAGNVGVNTHTL